MPLSPPGTHVALAAVGGRLIRSRLYAAPMSHAACCVRARQRKRVLRKPPMVLNQPKISSTFFRQR